VEVGLWGLIGKIFLAAMSRGWNAGNLQTLSRDGTLNFFELIIFNLVYALAFLSIPFIAAVVVRGASSSGIGGSALSAAAGVGVAAGGVMKSAAGGAASSVKGFAAGLSGGSSAGGDSGGRAGDSGAGSDTPLGVASAGGGSPASSLRAGDERRDVFGRNAAIRKQERERDRGND
jgi:hypothetical protein